jgi:TRAP-type C4-dicarboxylate transport system substrate-binding protein
MAPEDVARRNEINKVKQRLRENAQHESSLQKDDRTIFDQAYDEYIREEWADLRRREAKRRAEIKQQDGGDGP